MFGFFEWISDGLNPPEDAYDPAIARPRCKKCSKDAWLMWNGKYSAYCSTECQRNDRRRRPAASSADNLLPSCAPEEPSPVSVFERTMAAKKAARDIKAMAKKWAARKTERVKEAVHEDGEQLRGSQNIGENVHERLSFAQRQAEEAEFHKRRTHLAKVAQELAKEQLHSQEEKPRSNAKPPSTNERTTDIDRLRCSSFLETEAAVLQQAFMDELRREADEERRQIQRETHGDAVDEERRQIQRETHGDAVTESHDITQSAQVKQGEPPVSPRYEGKPIQAHVQIGEGNGSEIVDASSSSGRQRRTEEDKVCTGRRRLLDTEAHERIRQGTALEGNTSAVPREKYSRPVEQHEQSTRPPVDKTSYADKRHTAADQHWRGSTSRNSRESGGKKPFEKPVYTEGTRSLHEDEHLESVNLSDSRQEDRRLQQKVENTVLRNRNRTHIQRRADSELPAFVPNTTPRENGVKHDDPFHGKFSHLEKNHKDQFAKTPSSAVLQRDSAPVALRQDTPGTLRVAGTADTYISLDDLHQLRDAAWRETKTAVEKSCAECVHGQYGGTLEVHLQCAEIVNPTRVSPDDSIYIVVRCPVAEAEWIEKRSKCVSNLRWEESFNFPVFYEKYPRRARVCVQLWRQAPQRDDTDQFVGEGEIPFPLSTTRCALRVQLCWNTNLGGSVIDLDCGRLRLAVQLLQRIDPDEADSGLLQARALSRRAQEITDDSGLQHARALSRRAQEIRDGRQRTAAFLQTRTASNGAQKKTNLSRQTTEDSTDSRKVEAVELAKSVSHSRSKPDTEEEACKTAKRITDVKRAGDAKRKSARLRSLQINPLCTPKENTVLSRVRDSEKKDKIIVGEGAKGSSATTDLQSSSRGRHGMTQLGVASAAEKKLECSTAEKEVLQLPQKAGVPTMQEGKQDVNVHCTPALANALPLSTSERSTSESPAKGAAPTRFSMSSEDMASNSADVQTNIVKLDIRADKEQECVSNTTLSFRGERLILDREQSSRGTAVDVSFSLSAISQSGVSETELQVLLPVALAQMDDFARHDAEPECAPPAANLDSRTLVQPWRSGRGKRMHCANWSCRRIISSRYMNDLFEEEEFRAWGCCSACQAAMFRTKVSAYTDDVIQISNEPGKYDEFRLDSFIPVAFPSLHVIWPSLRHLYVAQRFTHVQIQERLRQCRVQRQLSLLLKAPLLKYFVRSDWSHYRHLALRTCIRLKIRQHPRLQLLLMSTGRSILYDPALPDFWEWESEDEAAHTNLVGKLLMELRKEYL